MEENKDLILQYAKEFDIPEETVSNTLSIEGDSYLDYITNALKKKGQPIVPTQITDQMSGQPMNQIDSRFEQTTTQPLQDQSSSASVTTPTQPSTGLELTLPASSGISDTERQQVNDYVKYLDSQPRQIPDFNYGTESGMTKNGKRGNIVLGASDNTIDILAGKPNEIQGAIVPKVATPEELASDEAKNKIESEREIAEFEKSSADEIAKYADRDYINKIPYVKKGVEISTWTTLPEDVAANNKNLEDIEKQGHVVLSRYSDNSIAKDDNGNYIYKIVTDSYEQTFNNYIDTLNSSIGENNINAARYNFGNTGNEPEQDSFGEFASKVASFGGELPSIDDYENLTSKSEREEYLAASEAAANSRKNGTTFQAEYDKVKNKYFVDENVKNKAGMDFYNSILKPAMANSGDNQSVLSEGNGKYASYGKDEYDYFQNFFSNPANVNEFGDWWIDEGNAKWGSSQVMENQLNYQKNRKALFTDFIQWKNDETSTDRKFIEESMIRTSQLADKLYADGDMEGVKAQQDKFASLEAKYQATEDKLFLIDSQYTQGANVFTQANKIEKERDEFNIRLQNKEFGASVQNFLGQIPLAIGTSVTSTLTGFGRIASSVIPSENLKDSLDIISDTQLTVGNVKVASLTDKVRILRGTDGFKYKEVNGKLYGLKGDGTIFKTNYKASGNEEVLEEDTSYNASGFAFLTAKMISDIYLTSGVGKGLNTAVARGSNAISNSRKVAQVFGEGSQIAKAASSFARIAKNADNVSVTGWYVQMYNDSYRMAEEGGIKDAAGKHLYAITQSFMQSVIQRINPDINFLKSMNNESRQIVSALMNNRKDKAVQLLTAFTNKVGTNVAKETGEELVQQVTQDINNIVINQIGNKNLQTASGQDYEELISGTIVPSAVASLLGGKGSRIANVNGSDIDLSAMNRDELVTELARDPRGVEIIRDFKENVYFQSQKDAAKNIEDEIETRRKYISKIPESQNYTSKTLSEAAPLLQEIDRKKEQLKADDGTFSERINNQIKELQNSVNLILDTNAENPTQSTPQSEAVQEQTNTNDNEPEQTAAQQTEPITPIEPIGGAGAESGVTLNTEPNGQTTPEIQSPTSQTQEDVQTSQAEGRDTTNQLPEMGGGNAEPEKVTQAQEEIKPIRQLGDGITNVYFESDNGKYRVNDSSDGKALLIIGDDGNVMPLDSRKFDTPQEAVEIAKELSNELPNGLRSDYHSIDGVIKTIKEKIQNEKQEKPNEQQVAPEPSAEPTDQGGESGNASGRKNTEGKTSQTEKIDAVQRKLESEDAEITQEDLDAVSALFDEVENVGDNTPTDEENQRGSEGDVAYSYPSEDSVQQNPTPSDNEEGKKTETITLSNPAYSLKVDTDSRGVKTFTFLNKSGKEVNPSSATRRKYLLEYLKNSEFQETQIPEEASPKDANYIILNESENPYELALAIANTEKYRGDAEVGSKLWQIADNMRRVKSKGVRQFGDKNKFTAGIAKSYFSRKNKPSENNSSNTIDQWAMDASSAFAGDYGGDEITTADVVRFIEEYPNGPDQFLKQKTDEYKQIEQRFFEITGLNPTENVLAELLGKKASNEQSKLELKKRAEEYYDTLTSDQQKKLADEYDEWFNSLTLEQQQEELIKTYPYDIQGITTRTGQTESQPQSGNTEGQGGKNADAKSGAEGSQEGGKKNSPEYQQLLKDRTAQEARVKSAKEKLDTVNKTTNKNFQQDQENLFGERQTDGGLFDERADGNAGRKVIEDAKSNYDAERNELARINKAIRDFESGKESGTGSIDFSEPQKTKKDVRETRKEDFKKSRAVRDEKINAKIDNALDDLLKTMRGKLNAGIDPEVGLKGAKLAAAYIEGRVYKLADILQDVTYKLGDISEDLFDAIKGGYASYRETATDDVYTNLDTDTRNLKYESFKKENVNLDLETNKETNNGKRKTIQSSGRTLQRNNKRLRQGERKKSLQKSNEEGTGRDGRTQGDDLSGADGKIRKTSDGQGGVLPTDANLLTPEEKIEQINQDAEQEPALVEFNLQDNNTGKFNTTQKFIDNINALKTLVTLLKEKRLATEKEKEILSKYVGFGGLKEILNNPDDDSLWKNKTNQSQAKEIVSITKELDSLLGVKDTLGKIRSGTLNAHYTHSGVIKGIYKGIEQLGFKGGRILEPSAGTGNFIGFMPNKIIGKSKITAVELDDVTGNILKHIYSDVDVKITGLESAKIPNNSQDLIISNIPFGNYAVFDKDFKGDKAPLTKRIHSYFFAKAIDQAREGGIIAFVTSKGVLDSPGNKSLREYINKNAEFLGAVRLPNTTFAGNANTAVVTDIIFLRKNTTGDKNNTDFINTSPMDARHSDGQTEQVNINNYFHDNPQNILGELEAGGMYNRNDYTVNGSLDNLTQRIQEMLPKGIYSNTQSDIGLDANDTTQSIEDIKEGNIAIVNGKTIKKVNGEIVEHTYPASINTETIEQYIELRDTLNELIYSEYLGVAERELNTLRAKLNRLYDAVHKSTKAKQKEFYRVAKDDNDGFNVEALTKRDGTKADIFTKRTIQPIQQKTSAANIDEAIIISLYENASIDIDRIAELLGSSVHEVKQLSKGKIFENPTGGFVTRDEYLSGNVKEKLKLAQEAVANGFTDFQTNIDELLPVIPKDIPATLIESRLGSRWIPTEIFEDFGKFLLNDKFFRLTYARTIDTYSTDNKSSTVEANEKYGTSRRNGAELLIDALHLNPPVIRDKTNDGKYVVNREETEKALEKYEEIRDLFNEWVNRDVARREMLSEIYNEKYNTTIKRKYDGSHLNIAGINGVQLYPHQKDAIWMLLQNNGGIIDHIVGAGKTFVMIAGTMEMKRTGVAKKPMIIALKSTIPQIVESYKSAYPMARILAPTEKDFTKDNRKKLFAQIANNEWDVIIMTHENYGKIPHEESFTRSFIEDEIYELEKEREELKGNRRALSGLELRLKNLRVKLEQLADRDTDNTTTFQQMGIDHIMVDESQQFKNLAYITKQRSVAGLSKAEGSSRAFNLFLGIRYLQGKLGGDKGTTFLSGTPISNSMVEMYLLLKYLRPNRMNEMGLNSFDQWATTFASPSNDIEFTVTGEFKNKLRFREFINVPELSILYNEIADVRNDDNLVLDKPKMKGDEYSFEVVPMSDEQLDYGERLIKFAKEKDGSHIGIELTEEKKSAIMLMTTTLASKMAIDMRLIDNGYSYDPNGKIGKMVENVYNLYKETDDVKGTQLVFSDIGTPKSPNKTTLLRDYFEDELGVNIDDINAIFGDANDENYKPKPYNSSLISKIKEVLEISDVELAGYLENAKNSNSFDLYSETKKRLVEKGIPENEIVFIHNYPTQKAKDALFEKVNNGEIRVVLGSTQKLGTGVNAQRRIVAIHHLDVPWRPSDMEQRNGRGLRQGNEIAKNHRNNEVGIFAYATERTLDAFKYGLLQTKQRFLDQVKSGTVDERSVSEGDEESGMLARIVAELSGNKDILEKSKLEQLTDRLKKSKRNFEGTVHDAEENVLKHERYIANTEAHIDRTEEDVKWVEGLFEYDENGKIKIDLLNGKTVEPVLTEKEIEKEKKEKKENKKEQRQPIRTDFGHAMIQEIKAKIKNLPASQEFKVFDFNNGITVIAKKEIYREDLMGKSTTQEKTILSVLTPSGSQYNFNYSETPGIFLNNLQKVFDDIPARLKSFKRQLEEYQKSIESYKELAANKEFPKQAELDKAQEDLKEVNKRLTYTEEAESTATPELQSTNANFTVIPQSTYDKLVKRLLGVFKKFGGKVITTKAEVDAKLKEFGNSEGIKTKDGEIYGAKFPDGTIYLNPEKVNANTPIHEFSHLWQQLMPSRFRKGVELLKNTPIGKRTFAELKSNEGYATKSDDELWNEALVTVMGNEGERIFNSSRTSKFKEWLVDLFKKLGDAFGISDLSPNDKLSTFVKGALSEVMGIKEIIPESSVEQKEVPVYIKKMSNADLRSMLDRLGLVMDAVCPN